MTKYIPFVLLSSLALSLGGCSKKIPECNAIVEVINPTVDKMNAIDMENEEDAKKLAAALDDARAVAEGASTKLGELEITTEELKGFVVVFKKALDTVAGEAKTASEGVLDMGTKEAELEKLSKTIATATGKLEVQCTNDPKICETIAAIFANAPEDVSDMRSAAGSLAALKPKNADLQATVTELSTTFTALADITEGAEKFVKQMEGTAKKIDAAIDTENETVDKMNTFCSAE